MKQIIYLILCILQPICLPVPELTTYLYGEKSIGSVESFIIGMIGVLIGLTIMYFLSRFASKYIIKKFKLEAKISKFIAYVRKYQILIIGVLLVIPILPDEIICLGSPLIGIKYLPFIIICAFAKALSISMVVFSKEISGFLSINQVTLIIIEILLCIIATVIFNYIDKKKKEK